MKPVVSLLHSTYGEISESLPRCIEHAGSFKGLHSGAKVCVKINMCDARTPETGAVERVEDWEGAVLEKVFLVEKAASLVHTLYGRFIRLRMADTWEKRIVPQIRGWVAS